MKFLKKVKKGNFLNEMLLLMLLLHFTISEYVKVLKHKTEIFIFIFIFARRWRALSRLKQWRAIFVVH